MSTTYKRVDDAIRVYASNGSVALTIKTAEGKESTTVAPAGAESALAAGALPVSFANALSALPQRASGSESDVHRVTIEVGVTEWAALHWERHLPKKATAVYTSPVRPRVLQLSITFPLRVLEVGGTPVVPGAMEMTFHGSHRSDAYTEGHTELSLAESFPMSEQWATVDILHVHHLADSAESGFITNDAGISKAEATVAAAVVERMDPDRFKSNLLSNAHQSPAGTVGWFLRFAERFQTRLIVLDGYPIAPDAHRLMAQSIIDRGGPAVLLLDAAPSTIASLYGEIAHDRPLDWIGARTTGSTLFCGRGGEEALRYSVVASQLRRRNVVSAVHDVVATQVADLRKVFDVKQSADNAITRAIVDSAKEMNAGGEAGVDFSSLWGTRRERFADSVASRLPKAGFVALNLQKRIKSMPTRTVALRHLTTNVAKSVKPLATMSRASAVKTVHAKLQSIGKRGRTYHFEDHESDGMLPLAAKVKEVRSIVQAIRGPETKPRSQPHVERHVTSAFYRLDKKGDLKEIPQGNARLTPCEVVHLGIDIGPKSKRVKSLGDAGLIEERIRWEGEGAWLEIGVTGIDFDVHGAAVQRFFLRRDEPSDRITFAVSPQKTTTIPGVARLRFTIYNRDNIVQSFFVAAVLKGATGDTARAMARALNVPTSDARKIGSAGYIARMEYSNAATIDDADSITPRALTILANDSAGDRVTTFKGDDLFSVSRANVTNEARAARDALLAASRRGAAYAFMNFSNVENAGDPEELCQRLWPIAQAGWDIYNAYLPDPEDKDEVQGLLENGGGIQAAHLDISKAIPWAVVYDRRIFHDEKISTSPRAVCRASLGSNGQMSDAVCGGAGCLLNAGDNEARRKAGKPEYSEETVICPRHFWGFMHPIDVPVQTVDRLGRPKKVNLAESIKVAGNVRVIAGFNPNLTFAAKHINDLTIDIRENRKGASVLADSGRGAVWSLITNNDPDIVYLYCHALANAASGAQAPAGPFLDFGLGFKGTVADLLNPGAFGKKPSWTHAPLVMLNGCSTAGFEDYLASKFIEQFIRGNHAAAVIGTETTVVEILAKEVGRELLKHVVAGESAGEALLHVRRTLLEKNNPLGLMYALYGSSRLKLLVS